MLQNNLKKYSNCIFQTILKWAKDEGQQRGFLSVRRAKIVENAVGSLDLLHNRYQMIISQSLDWLFLCRKSAYHKGICKTLKFYPSFSTGQKRPKNLSDSPFFSKTERHVIQRMSFYNSLNNTK